VQQPQDGGRLDLDVDVDTDAEPLWFPHGPPLSLRGSRVEADGVLARRLGPVGFLLLEHSTAHIDALKVVKWHQSAPGNHYAVFSAIPSLGQSKLQTHFIRVEAPDKSIRCAERLGRGSIVRIPSVGPVTDDAGCARVSRGVGWACPGKVLRHQYPSVTSL
jgi:hypothetical protein